MTTHDPSAQDREDHTQHQCSDPSHRHLDEHEHQVHRLIHEGIDATEGGQLEQAQAAFDQALTLAQTHALPVWEAQALFGQGGVLDRLGRPTDAVPFFERSLALFAESGSVRMEVTLSIFLSNMLTKTGEPSRSLPILLHAKNQADQGHAQGQLSPHEYEYGLYGLYRELGRAYQALGQLPPTGYATRYEQASRK